MLAGAFFSGLAAALAMALVNQRTQLREDAVIGIVFTTFFAVGIAHRFDQPDLGQHPVDRARQHSRHHG
jgi:hypothetical protein